MSGKIMIAEGGKCVSRGSLNEAVMGGEAMLSFISLHLSAIESSSWTGLDLELISHMDWFQKGHDI